MPTCLHYPVIRFVNPSFRRAGRAVVMGLAVAIATGLTAARTNLASAGERSIELAQSSNPPAALQQLVGDIDAAAGQEDLDTTLNYYARSFQRPDGLDRNDLSAALQEFWERYDNLTYTTHIDRWNAKGDDWVIETTTTIDGDRVDSGRPLVLQSTIRSRQSVRDGQIVSQEILSEQTQLTTGDRPPTVNIRLPESVRPGEKFNFDVIVEEPLGDDLLLGAAIDEPVSSSQYLNPSDVQLEPLKAGGIFKVGRAPDKAGDRWISAVLISGNGLTSITRRLRVER